ncbi:MAG: DUF3870 domain-containing protein [Planctomycetota bacterium]|jgi:hypothetical protein
MSREAKAKQEKFKLRQDTVVISGVAKLPENNREKNPSHYITIEFEINPADSKVVDMHCTLLPLQEKQLLRRICLGNKIGAGIRKAITQLALGVARPAVIVALEDAYKWYEKYQAKNN